jgi:replicative DNA helicase
LTEADLTIPPHNAEAERAVLSCMLRDNRVINDVVQILPRKDYFYADAHQKLFETIIQLNDKGGQPVDLVTLWEALRQRGYVEDIGGKHYLAEIYDTSGSAANVEYYAHIVRDKALVRGLILVGNDILVAAHNQAMPGEQLVEEAEQKLFTLSRDGIIDDERSAAEVVGEVFTRIDERDRRIKDGGPHAIGLPTGLASLDNVQGGLHRSELIVIAARPSVGKTTMGLTVSLNVSLEVGAHVLFISLEQARAELMERAMCNLAGIDGKRLRMGTLTTEEMERLHSAGEQLQQAKLRFSDNSSQRLLRIAGAARRARHKGQLDLLVIDYLQLIEPESRKEPRHEQVASISRGLKRLARELAIPVVVMAQLNRESEKRSGERPRLSDLRESGAIEADADVVLLLHRNTDKRSESSPWMQSSSGSLEVIVAKNRNGPTDVVLLSYDRHLHRFRDAG